MRAPRGRIGGKAAAGALSLALALASSCAPPSNISLTPAEVRFLDSHKVITWAPDRSYAPVEWVDDAGQVKGLCPDYLTLLGRKLGVRFEPVLTKDWDEALAAVRDGRIDMVSAITDLPERHRQYAFTAAYLDLPTVLLVRTGDSTKTLAALGTRTLAIQHDYALSQKLVRESYPQVRIVAVESSADGLQKLALGEADAALADLAQASWTIEELHLTGIRVAGPIPELPAKFAMAVRPDQPLLRSVLDKALASLTESEKQELRRRWIGLQMVGWRASPEALGILGAALAGTAILLVLLWNRALRRQVQERTSELAMAAEALQLLTLTDTLTGLRNRRYLDAAMPDDVARVKRLHIDLRRRPERLHKNVDLLFAMIDLDGFKAVNDTHGHAAGDRVLRHVSEALRRVTRDTDTVVRWGGEEFLIVGRNTDRAEIPGFVERIREAVAARPCDLGDGTELRCACSIGFALMPFLYAEPEFLDWEQVVDIADRCLYVAKRSGRNRAVGLIASNEATSADLAGQLGDIAELARSPLVRVVTTGGDASALDWS